MPFRRGIAVAIAAGFFAVTLSACDLFESERSVFASYRAPQGESEVVVEVEEPGAAFAPHTIYVSLSRKGDAESSVPVSVLETQLANDGASLNPSNIRARWETPQRLWLCLRGEEQADQLLSIDISAVRAVVQTRECGDGWEL